VRHRPAEKEGGGTLSRSILEGRELVSRREKKKKKEGETVRGVTHENNQPSLLRAGLERGDYHHSQNKRRGQRIYRKRRKKEKRRDCARTLGPGVSIVFNPVDREVVERKKEKNLLREREKARRRGKGKDLRRVILASLSIFFGA